MSHFSQAKRCAISKQVVYPDRCATLPNKKNIKRLAMKRKGTTLVCIMFFCLNTFSQTNSTKRIYEVWDDQPAPNRGKDYSRIQSRGHPADPDWEAHSYPIGN